MRKFVAHCDYTKKFRQTVLNWIIHQIKHNYNAHYSITYLEHGEIKGHGPASSQSYNLQEAVTKTVLTLYTAFQKLVVTAVQLTDLISISFNAAGC